MNDCHENRGAHGDEPVSGDLRRSSESRIDIKQQPTSTSNESSRDKSCGNLGPEPKCDVSPRIPQYYLPAIEPYSTDFRLFYRPAAIGIGRARYVQHRDDVGETQEFAWLTPIIDDPIPVEWARGEEIRIRSSELEILPRPGAAFDCSLHLKMTMAQYHSWKRDLLDAILRYRRIGIFRDQETGHTSFPGEPESEFRERLSFLDEQAKDRALARIREVYSVRVIALQDRIRLQSSVIDQRIRRASELRASSILSILWAILGAFSGRKVITQRKIDKAASAFSASERAAASDEDVIAALNVKVNLEQDLVNLEARIKEEIAETLGRYNGANRLLEQYALLPKKSGSRVSLVALAWVPYWQAPNGEVFPAW